MAIDIEEIGRGVLIRPRGALLGGEVNMDLHEEVRRQLRAGRNRVAISLKSVPWLNSSGIGTLLGCANECAESGGGLILTRANEHIQDLLSSLDLLDRLPMMQKEDRVREWLEKG